MLSDTLRANALVGANKDCIGFDSVATQADLRVLRPATMSRHSASLGRSETGIISASREKVMTRKLYGIELKPRGEPVRPIPIDLSGPEGERIVRSAVKRVLETHKDVIKALAKR